VARFEAGTASDPAALDANYVRRSDVKLFWTDARRTDPRPLGAVFRRPIDSFTVEAFYFE
jgi:hypothetical protein